MTSFLLTSGWQFKQQAASGDLTSEFQTIDDAWLPATVPGSVHQDLIASKRIPDPFFGTNEKDVVWVGEADWLYHCTFDLTPADFSAEQIDLCFDGLDTFASVWLNGDLVLISENMFVPARVPAKKLLKASGNTLWIRFESAMRRGHELEVKFGKRQAWNGDASRVHVRKAQYHYGWDWGPVLMTAGLWRPVRVEAYSARITEVDAPTEVNTDLQSATVSVTVKVANAPANAVLDIKLFDPRGTIVQETSVPANDQTAQRLNVAKPDLWYPRAYGAQAQYQLKVNLRDGDKILDTHSQRFGLRRLRLVQEALTNEPGTSFYFEINNIPLFCGGANWIPADSFSPRVTAEQYRQWLQLAADANMTMLRVWGGGIYEEDVFYDLCDELGLLVWQDFMFACGLYPAHDEFLSTVRAEVESNVRRLRHHPSLAIWCGNNEDYQVAESVRVYKPAFEGDFRQTDFPAREIYERLLPDLCAKLDPTRPYWRGSPYAGETTADGTVGDRHVWDIWHGAKAPYQDYPKYSGRFVSEFGMASAPALPTLEAATRPEDRDDVYGTVLRAHNKAGEGPERIQHYLRNNAFEPNSLEGYIYLSQFIQAEALAAGIDGWRRQWSGVGQYAVSGALVWQLNDCWPVISWALADYYLRPKAAYYRVRRALAPVVLGIADAASGNGLSIWAVNGTTSEIEADLNVQSFGFDGTRLGQELRHVTLPPGRSKALVTYNSGLIAKQPVAVNARLIEGETVIARAAKWPDPPKAAAYQSPGVKLTVQAGQTVTLSTQRPARAVVVQAGDAVWSDNLIDLFPGDDQVIHSTSGQFGEVSARWYGSPLPAAIVVKI